MSKIIGLFFDSVGVAIKKYLIFRNFWGIMRGAQHPWRLCEYKKQIKGNKKWLLN